LWDQNLNWWTGLLGWKATTFWRMATLLNNGGGWINDEIRAKYYGFRFGLLRRYCKLGCRREECPWCISLCSTIFVALEWWWTM
jgi:hypothetical protein